jgi:hypothetical protein
VQLLLSTLLLMALIEVFVSFLIGLWPEEGDDHAHEAA